MAIGRVDDKIVANRVHTNESKANNANVTRPLSTRDLLDCERLLLTKISHILLRKEKDRVRWRRNVRGNEFMGWGWMEEGKMTT